MSRNVQSLLIFILVLVVLNWFLGEMDYGIHISIVGSLVLTFVVSLIMSGIGGGSRR